MKKDIVDALVSIGGKFEIKDTYSTLVWKDDVIPKPTEAEINAEISRLQAEFDSQAYARNRASEYPDLAEQLDYIYHNGVTKWKSDMIKPVKDKYPKG